jgi:hypothetical protein
MAKDIVYKHIILKNLDDITQDNIDSSDIKRIAYTDEVDREGDKASLDFLKEMASLIVGKPLLIDHGWSANNNIGRVTWADVEEHNGLNCVVVKLDVLDEDALVKVKDGRYKELSVGFSTDHSDIIDGVRILEHCTDVVEISFVAVPAVPSAGLIVKSLSKGGRAMNLLKMKSLFNRHPELKSLVENDSTLIEDVQKMDDEEVSEDMINDIITENEELKKKNAALEERIKAFEDAEASKNEEDLVKGCIGKATEQYDVNEKACKFVEDEIKALYGELDEKSEDALNEVVSTVLDKYKELGLITDKVVDETNTDEENVDAADVETETEEVVEDKTAGEGETPEDVTKTADETNVDIGETVNTEKKSMKQVKNNLEFDVNTKKKAFKTASKSFTAGSVRLASGFTLD